MERVVARNKKNYSLLGQSNIGSWNLTKIKDDYFFKIILK